MLGVSVSIFGSQTTCLTEAEFNSLVREVVAQPHGLAAKIFAHYNLHGLHLLDRHAQFKAYFDQVEYSWIDGLPVVFMLRLLGYPIRRDHRITFLDWQHSFFAQAQKFSYRIYLLGGTQENILKATTKLQVSFPNIAFQHHHGYFDSLDDTNDVLKSIEQHNTDILLVGMGMPRQEQWILTHRDRISAKCVFPLGGYFDYIAGMTKTPPRWLGRWGLEGVFRLLYEPKRLWKRYLLEPFIVIPKFLREFLKART